MHKSTVILIVACFALTAGVGWSVWAVWHYKPTLTIPQVGGSSVKFGLDLGIEGDKDQPYVADGVVLLDTTDNRILFQQKAFERHSIASISKLMTAMVASDYGIPWNQEADIQLNEYGPGGELILAPGETVTMRDLFNASLLGSANNATFAYVRQLGIPTDEFIQAMNRKAVELGLEQTEFHDVTGLDPHNVSTAYEVAIMAKTAFEKYPEIAKATTQKEYSFTVLHTGREHTIHNTNKLILDGNEPSGGSKTGFLYEANYCLVMAGGGELSHRLGVVLGTPSENGQFIEMKQLLHMTVK